MKEKSKRMLEAGWVIQMLADGQWSALSPENRHFVWADGKWDPGETQLMDELEANEQAIREGRYSPFAGTSRLTSTADPDHASLLCQWAAKHAETRGSTVLRARCTPDPVGDELLYAAGARRVETLLQPWAEAPHSVRHLPSRLLLCEHVAEVLPKPERQRTLQRILTHLHGEARAYFSFYQLEALPAHLEKESSGDGYIFHLDPHRVFIKPSLPGQCAPALMKMLGGFAEEVDLLYNTIICRWLPDA